MQVPSPDSPKIPPSAVPQLALPDDPVSRVVKLAERLGVKALSEDTFVVPIDFFQALMGKAPRPQMVTYGVHITGSSILLDPAIIYTSNFPPVKKSLQEKDFQLSDVKFLINFLKREDNIIVTSDQEVGSNTLENRLGHELFEKGWFRDRETPEIKRFEDIFKELIQQEKFKEVILLLYGESYKLELGQGVFAHEFYAQTAFPIGADKNFSVSWVSAFGIDVDGMMRVVRGGFVDLLEAEFKTQYPSEYNCFLQRAERARSGAGILCKKFADNDFQSLQLLVRERFDEIQNKSSRDQAMFNLLTLRPFFQGKWKS